MREEKTIEVNGSREQIRKALILEFLEEKPGKGTGELCSTYVYWVEQLVDGNRVFLKRPARLNKGMDFEVHVENTYFNPKRKTTMPSHQNIYDDLTQKKIENPKDFEIVRVLITKIYETSSVEDKDWIGLNFKTGKSIEAVLKVIKWLFIEQDITYWNWTGRDMFYSGIKGL